MNHPFAKEIIKRGYITKKESKIIDLNKFANKINLIDDNGDTEGIWAAILTDRDQNKYNNSSSIGETITAVILNDAICWFPNKTWGRVIQGTTNGNQRPKFLARNQIKQFIKTNDAYINEHYSVDNKMKGN